MEVLSGKSLLVIGGTGVLSSAVVKEALKKNISVTVLNRGMKSKHQEEGTNVIIGDFHDEESMKKLLGGRRFDAVIDFICYTLNEVKYSYRILSSITNQYIFISSCAVYDTRFNKIFKEDDKQKLDIWSYSVEKADCENWLFERALTDSKNVTVIRPSVTYGDTRIPYGILPAYGYHGTFIQRILNDKPIITWDDGKTKCNKLHVDDFAVGIVGVISNQEAYNQAFNICGDVEAAGSWEDLLICLEKILNKKIIRFNIPSEFYANEIPERRGELLGGRSLDAICSNEKIKRVVPAFKQTISLEEGLTRTIAAYSENNWQSGMDYKFDGDMDRIIKKYARLNHIKIENERLKYIDYLGNHSKKDFIAYIIGRNQKLGKILRFFYRLFRCIWKKVKN